MAFLVTVLGLFAAGIAVYLLILALCAASTAVCRRVDRRTARRKADAAGRVLRWLDLTRQTSLIASQHSSPGGADQSFDLARATGSPWPIPEWPGPDPAHGTARGAPASTPPEPGHPAQGSGWLGRRACSASGPQGRWIEAALPPHLRRSV